MAVEPLSFGPFTLDPGSGTLRRDGKAVPVGQRGAALLRALIEAEGEAVPKSDLMEAAWPGVIVEEGNLTVQIAALRKALGAAADGRDWIATIPRFGYRLLVQATAVRAPEPSDQPALAVLPFQNLGSETERDWFADGVVEDIITALSRFRSFAVIARNSSFAYKGERVDVRQVAGDLGVRYVLEGSVRRAGSRLRITAQLVDGVSGTSLWGQSFDGGLDDVFEFQDQITERVAMVVEPYIQSAELKRSRRERPGSIAVYDLSLQAWSKIRSGSDDDNAQACGLLMKALAIEPNDPVVIAYAVMALGHRSIMGWPEVEAGDSQKCIDLARRGLLVAGGDPMVMAQCADALLHQARDYELAMAVVASAASANPHNHFVIVSAGVAHLHCGSVAEAQGYFHKTIRLSPRDPFANIPLCGIAHAQMVLGDYEEALAWALRSLAVSSHYAPALWMLIAANAHLGRMDEARHFLAKLEKIAPDITIARIVSGQPAKDPTRLASVFEGLRLAGMRAD